jgi:hypothetical protein
MIPPPAAPFAASLMRDEPSVKADSNKVLVLKANG